MALTFFSRVSTLLKADAHGVVESLEERSLLLKQYLREAEFAFDQSRARLEAVREESKRITEEIAHGERDLAALDDDVQLALAAGKDDLARFALRRLIPRRKDVKQWRAQRTARATEATALEERVTEQQRQLDALRTRVRAALLRGRTADPVGSMVGDDPVADEEVELELMRRRAPAGGAA